MPLSAPRGDHVIHTCLSSFLWLHVLGPALWETVRTGESKDVFSVSESQGKLLQWSELQFPQLSLGVGFLVPPPCRAV